MRKKKVFVAGGAGYLGSVLVPELLKHGNKVTVLDNLMHDQHSLLECCANSDFDFIRGDICDEGLISSLIPQYDIIIMLAALVGAPACKTNPTLTKLVNYDAPVALIKKLSSSQKLIFPTTNSGYGVGEKDKFCTEESPLEPLSVYGKLKVDLRLSFYRVLEKAGIKDFRWHDLRHTFATRLAQAGVDLYKISKLLGHKDIKMTQRYSHHCPDSLRDGVEILESDYNLTTIEQKSGFVACPNPS